jgi:3-dehydroquinate synthase
MRGIEFLSIPTSLLAMVDAAIGGKTGINTNFGKNLLGTFYFPINTLILPDFLKTLSNEHFNNGMAEVIKCAIIDDASFFK